MINLATETSEGTSKPKSEGANGSVPPRILREEMALKSDFVIGTEHLDEAHAFWQSLKAQAGCMPDWTAFKPFEHAQLLPYVILNQRIGGRFRCSLVGETVRENLPLKLAGHFIDDVMPVANVQDMTRRFEACLDTGEPNFVEKTMAWQLGKDLRSYSSLQLPFSGATTDRILSVMAFRADSLSA